MLTGFFSGYSYKQVNFSFWETVRNIFLFCSRYQKNIV